jgi:hypothetical protein
MALLAYSLMSALTVAMLFPSDRAVFPAPRSTTGARLHSRSHGGEPKLHTCSFQESAKASTVTMT